jgi:NHL repeat
MGPQGNEPGKFQVAHGIGIDVGGLVWVADRENQRIKCSIRTASSSAK